MIFVLIYFLVFVLVLQYVFVSVLVLPVINFISCSFSILGQSPNRWNASITSESDSSSIVKDEGYSTITHVDINRGSRSGKESSHLILQDLQCDFRFDLFFSFSFSFPIIF